MTTHSVMQTLEEWFSKPLKELPLKLRQIAEAHIPNWDDLPTSGRRATALNIDEYCAAWIDSELRIEFWWIQNFVSAQDAATLLYGQKPGSTETPGKSDTFNDAGGHETTPEDFDHLIKVFKNHERDEPAKRTMNDWFTIVENANRQYKGTLEPKRGMKYHCWIDAWLAVNTDKKTSQVLPAEPVTPEAKVVPATEMEATTEAPPVLPAAALLEQTGDAGLSKRERQIRAIELAIVKLGLPAMSIPTGGKNNVQVECKRASTLFGGGIDPFKEAWQAAVSQNRVRTVRHRQYSGK